MTDEYRHMAIHELLAAVLAAKIVAGELACGEILPTEASLMRRYQVSRQTVRRALAVLWHERLIDHLPGIGLHVRMPDKKTVINLDRREQATWRPSTLEERRRMKIAKAAGVIEIRSTGVVTDVLPADRVILR